MMATGVMRNLHLRVPSPVYFPLEEEEEEERWSTDEDEDETLSEPRVLSDPQDATERLLRFAEVISRDVRRYFGRDVYDEGAASDDINGGGPRYDEPLRPLVSAREEHPSSEHPSSELGPLAELFESRGKGQGRPMNARHLPLSFWNEPDPPELHDGDTHMNFSLHTLENSQPDFSDLLANWDPNPDDTDVLH
ncbi:protein PERCC1 [Syngnathus typhle]|uniref:protein PERCC1 n=1 Tax=Syngnathus typhle TaxID=161592 RepID=UPI002A6AA693|nr:protein PERCC1 [Syngnathus typhle]